MNFLIYTVPITLGIAAVLQGGFNRKIAQQWGLGPTVLFNSACLFTISLCLFLVSKYLPNILPNSFRDRGAFSNIRWWYALPGFFGAMLVTGIPYTISRLGSAKVFLGIIAAQILTSLVWDLMIESIPLTTMRLVGALITVLGVCLVSY